MMPMLLHDPNIESGETKALDAAIIKAITGARSIEKDGRNEHSRYNYAKADDIIEEAREALAAAGVLVSTLNQWDGEFRALNWQGQPDNSRQYLVLFKASHPESGQWRIYRRFCTYSDRKGTPWDKGLLGCQTTVLAYFLRDLLLLPRVDESIQPDQRNDTNHGKDSDMPRIDFNDVNACRRFAAWRLKSAGFSDDQAKDLMGRYCKSVGVDKFDDTDRVQRRTLIQALINSADPITGELLSPGKTETTVPEAKSSGSFAGGFSDDVTPEPDTSNDEEPRADKPAPAPEPESTPEEDDSPPSEPEGSGQDAGDDKTEQKQRVLKAMHEAWQEHNPDLGVAKSKTAMKAYLKDVFDGQKVADVSLGELQGVMVAVQAGKVKFDRYDQDIY
jgi:hypothetical protein